MSDVEPGQKLYAVKWGAMKTWTVEEVTAKQINVTSNPGNHVQTISRGAAAPYGVVDWIGLHPTAEGAAASRIALLTSEIAARQREIDALTAGYLGGAS